MDKISITRGSDLIFECQWKDSDGVALNLTGYTVAVFEPSVSLEDKIILTFADASIGKINGKMEWDSVLKNGDNYFFSIRITNAAGLDICSPRIGVSIT